MRQRSRVPRRHKATWPARWLTPAVVFTAVLAGMIAFARRERPGAEGTAEGRPVQTDSDGYASSSACRACHPAEYSTWHASYHRSMTQIATSETVKADFDGLRVDDVQGRPMRLERRGAEFWAEFDDSDAAVFGPPPRITRQVVM